MRHLFRAPMGSCAVEAGICCGRSGGLSLSRRGLRGGTWLHGETWCGGYEKRG